MLMCPNRLVQLRCGLYRTSEWLLSIAAPQVGLSPRKENQTKDNPQGLIFCGSIELTIIFSENIKVTGDEPSLLLWFAQR
jgi:hypothetical protein